MRKTAGFNEFGNIDIVDMTARIYAQTDNGYITGSNITPLDKILLTIPADSGYKHNFIEDMKVEYDYKMYSDEQFAQCKENALSEFISIDTRHGDTLINTVTEDGTLRTVEIKKK